MKSRSGTVPLARALSKLGIASRSEAVALIRDGRVEVNDRVARSPRQMVVPERARVAIDGRPVGRARWLTVLLHKPRGVVTTRRDPQGRPTVLDLVADAPGPVFPVGRLDLATSGLLLLTNDSRFADWITDPVNQVPRTYLVTVRGRLDEPACEAMAQRIAEAGALRRPAIHVRKLSRRETHLVVTLSEGRNREVRRLFDGAGREVTRLKRVAFGNLTLEDLPPGRWRIVSRDELAAAFPGAPIRQGNPAGAGSLGCT